MPSLALFLIIAWVTLAAGRQVASWLRLPESATRLERTLIGFALGLGLLAYGVMALGLVGLLYRADATAWLGVLTILGHRQYVPMLNDIREGARDGLNLSGWGWGTAALCGAFFVVSAVGVYTPPATLEWDSLAYHLADPKLYVQAHRIFYIPWEDHSNFAFNTEMCYTLGLLFGSVPLAKWFHWACGVGSGLALICLGRRFLSPRVGGLAALLFTALPLVFWEAGTAYVDLATTFYTTLTLLAAAHGVAERSRPWLGVSAVLLGLTLATKGTALSALGLLGIGLFWWQWRQGIGAGRSLGRTVAWAGLSLAVGAPWYVKSWALTGNPVYPFFYSLFGGKHWSADNAGWYNAWNASFGLGRSFQDGLLTPWALTMNLLRGHPVVTGHASFNDAQMVLLTLTPLFVAALFFPVFQDGPVPRAVRALSLYALGALLLWFLTAQHVRYLLPVLPVFCLLTAWALDRALVGRLLSGYALAGLAACSLLFSAYLGVVLTAQEVPVVMGRVSQADYLAIGNQAYPAVQFINSQIPAGSKIVFYGNPLGFYCDRPYLWGEQEHSTYIPYDSCHSGADLGRVLRKLGVTHLLINTAYFNPSAGGRPYTRLVADLVASCGPPVYGSQSDPRQRVFVFALPPPGK